MADANVDALRAYVNRYGFQNNRDHYFRTSRMSQNQRTAYEAAGLIENVGTMADLKEKVTFPSENPYYRGGAVTSSVIYKLSDPSIMRNYNGKRR